MNSILYAILPGWMIQRIRRKRDAKRRLRLALRERPVFHCSDFLDP